MQKVQQDLLSVYEGLLKNLSNELVHSEDLHASLKQLPDVTENLLAYEGLGYFSPHVASTNMMQICKRIPPEVLHELIVISMLRAALSFELEEREQLDCWHDVAELTTRYHEFSQQFFELPASAITSSIITVLCYTIGSKYNEFTRQILTILERFPVPLSINLTITKLLQEQSQLADEVAKTYAQLSELVLGLTLYDGGKLVAKKVQIEEVGDFTLLRMLLHPTYIRQVSIHKGFIRLNHYTDYLNYKPLVQKFLYY
ncbi:hypothetical protein [Psychrobium sp. 1_MG-2023]|uniref:hypothetical protein n=1 Tax=Psychrobium sp. 1_MG-2023 TaxID=3062624 RepID=UPI000C325C27|nr:hypothetical protein [Psychrobium sp. 1_MG-2023]MDP2559857.1 hypothetical protein [Psychrobium sp. 1_MG-2023]PKF59041.1 hypothetical protein CW748_02300 [Alteromonadales bacterium alter-6D02]